MLFYAEATRVLGEVDRLQTATAQIREGQAGRLAIASHPWAAISLLPKLVAEFLATRPGVSVRLISRHSDVVSQLLPSESFDIGIAELPIDETSVKLSRYQMRCVVVLPPRHPLAARKVLTPNAASGLPMVAPARSLQLPARLIAVFAAAGAHLNSVVEAEFLASLCGLVAAGTGWALVDPLVGRKASAISAWWRACSSPRSSTRSACSIAATASPRCSRLRSSSCWRPSLAADLRLDGAIAAELLADAAYGATSTTSATAAAGFRAPRARGAPSRSCASA